MGKLEKMLKILKILSERGEVALYQLSDELGVSKRSVQRYIKELRAAGFPIVRKSPRSGIYRLEKDLSWEIEKLTETEIAVLFALRSALKELGGSFPQVASSIINRLLEAEEDVVVFNLDLPKKLSKHEEKNLSRLVDAIKRKRKIKFTYRVYSEYEVEAKPYRIVFFRGLWYLIAETPRGIRSFSLDKISRLKLQETFKNVPECIKKAKFLSPFFSCEEKEIRIKVLANDIASSFFKRKQVGKEQRLIEEIADGSCIFECCGNSLEELENLVIYPWLLHIKILEPESVRNAIIRELEEYLNSLNTE